MCDAYRLSFLVPRALALSVPDGRHHPCLAGCVLTVHHGFCTIEGPSREQVFDQFRRWLLPHARGHGPLDITMILRSPRRGDREKWIGRHGGGADSWTAIVGADVAIVPGRVAIDVA